MYKILIADDEKHVLDGLDLSLRAAGHMTILADRGDRALELALSETPDLLILDVRMPGLSGFDLCRELRRKGVRSPIIFLSGYTEEIDRVIGLEIDGDDYVTKPFFIRELVARVGRNLRRLEAAANAPPPLFRFGDVEVDFQRRVAARRGKEIDLTNMEFKMLEHFVRHTGQVLSREQFLADVWLHTHSHGSVTTRTVDTHVLRLRQKLESDPGSPRYFLTVHGGGYRFVP